MIPKACHAPLLLLLLTAPVFAQDAQPPAEKKMQAAPTTPGAATARDPIIAAKQQTQEAQREAESLRRDWEQKLRQQAELSQLEAELNQLVNRNQDIFGKIRINYPASDSFLKTYGFDFVEADPVLRAQLSLPAGEGLVVVSVTTGGAADRSGIKEKDVIAKIDMKPVANVARAKEIIAKPDSTSVYLDLYRAGEPVHLTMKLPEPAPGSFAYWIGVPVSSVDATLRSHLPNLPADAGLVVLDVVANSPAARGGIQKNDILVKADGKPLTSNEGLVERIQTSEGKEIRFETLRASKTLDLFVRPERRPQPMLPNTRLLSPELPIPFNRAVPKPTDEWTYDDIIRNPYLIDGMPTMPRANWLLHNPSMNPEMKQLGELSRQIDELKRAIAEIEQRRSNNNDGDKKPNP